MASKPTGVANYLEDSYPATYLRGIQFFFFIANILYLFQNITVELLIMSP